VVSGGVLGVLLLLAWCSPASAAPEVKLLRVNGSINPAIADYVNDGIAVATRDAADALLIELDTPGGLLASTRTIVKEILGAPLPVLVYVAPSGAGAGSAGVFIVMSANVAAMAPGTNIGASTPVQGAGGDIEGVLGEKVTSFTASFAKSIAAQRGRNVEWAEKSVREAVSATDAEALQLGIVDLVAVDVADLLRQSTGRTVVVGGASRTLDLTGARVVEVEMQLKQRVLALLADPMVAYLLLLAGLLGLYLELSQPGTLLPGVTGAICLLVALAAFQVLPINTTGIALLVLGVALLVAEMFVPSFGVIGAGGLVAFVLGSLLFFDEDGTGLAVDRGVIGAAATAVGALMLTLALLVVRAMRRRVLTGAGALLGELCEVRSRIAPRGTVLVQGEIWQAASDRPIDPGSRARVTGIDGLTLRVEPAESKEASPE
jgi:membrane-bound serine protease (ClpP class)